MKAVLKNYRQAPRKVRLVTDLVKGKPVDQALLMLEHTDKRATRQLEKLIRSAVANAKEQNMDTDDLYIKDFRVDDGFTLKRFRPVWRGMAHPIRKRTSHITLELEKREAKK